MTLNQMKLTLVLALFSVSIVSFIPAEAHAGDVDNGSKLYTEHCVTCHGVDGINVMPDAPNFAHSEKLLRPDVFILASIKQGINAMPAYQGLLEDQDILDVIAYLRTLENGGPMRP